MDAWVQHRSGQWRECRQSRRNTDNRVVVGNYESQTISDQLGDGFDSLDHRVTVIAGAKPSQKFAAINHATASPSVPVRAALMRAITSAGMVLARRAS